MTAKKTNSLANIKKLKTFVLLLAVSFCLNPIFSSSLLAAQTLPEFNASYAITKYGIKVAEAHYQLSHTDTGYKFTQKTRLYGFASMFRDDRVDVVSYIDQLGDELLLREHNYIQTGKEKNKDESFSIEWDNNNKPATGTITGIVRGKKINLKTDSAVWEVLSFQIPLMIEASEDKEEYLYNAILQGSIDTYNFTLTSSDHITFSGKQYQALQMVRVDPHKNRELHIWLAPKLNNLPVIVENFQDGKQHTLMQLESVQFNNSPLLTDHTEHNDDDF